MADNGISVLIFSLSAGYKSVKIALILSILNDTVFLKLALGKGFLQWLLSLFLYDAALLPR